MEWTSVFTGTVRRMIASRLLPVGLAMLFFLYGLSQINEYGMAFDEPIHRFWGEKLLEYFRTGDRSILGMLASDSLIYAPLQYLAHYGIALTMERTFGMTAIAAYHVVTLGFFSFGIVVFFLLTERLGRGTKTALMAVAFLLLFPQLLGHTHYNPKDVPMLVYAVLLFFALERTYRGSGIVFPILAGIVLGLAASLKLPVAFLLLAIFCACVGLELLLNGRRTDLGGPASLAFRVAVVSIAACVVFLFTWLPYIGDPSFFSVIGTYLFANVFDDAVTFLGQVYGSLSMPLTFYPLHFFFATPVLTAIGAAIGSCIALGNIRAGKVVFERALPVLWLFVPLLLTLTPGIARYDGMRLLFFCVPALAILAADGLIWCGDALRRNFPRQKACSSALLALVFGWLIIEVARVHPFEGSYMNEAVRMAKGNHLERWVEIEYWGAPYMQGVLWLSEHAETDAVVCMPISIHVMPYYEEIAREDITFRCAPESAYIMFMTRFTFLPPELRVLYTMTPVHTITRYGSDLLYIFKVR